MINVLLVDDHDLVRYGLRKILGGIEGIEVVAEASTGEEAVSLAATLRPNVALMDVLMPGIGGVEATRKLLRASQGTRVVALTACSNDPYPAMLLQAGALCFVTKDSGPEELVRAIRAAHAGQRYISPKVAQRIALKHLAGGDKNPFQDVSDREMQVLLMIAEGLEARAIADRLCISPKTVNSYRYRLFEKLHLQNDVELTLLAMRFGLIDTERLD